ncbi:facilitated trehalose transporter Tret1-like [Schistocerca piceifrons]|uniref:facilitated trehalose transporter Tret1-like n=1 Tax=Schistocerca piceifrons TaxID=274613 RepID=UPI001F5F81D0|nr:facilitated trehalose transporter Tret1-like [Schistocerca piceifrons]
MPGEKAATGVATQFLAAFVANIVSLHIGFTVGWTAVAIPVLESNSTLDGTNPLDKPLTKYDASWLASLSMVLSIFGPTACSLSIHRWGFKPTGYIVGIFSALSGVIVLVARSFAVLLAGRILIGLATGGGAVVSTNYVAGAAQAHVRGALGTFFALMFNGGILLAYLVGAASSYFTVCVVGVAVPTVYTVCFFFLPESPLHLLSKGREEEAARSLRWFRATGHDVAGELKEMRLTIEAGQGGHRKRMTVAQFFKERASRYAFAAIVVLILNQQLNGSLVALNYVVEMLAAAGDSVSAGWSAVAVAALQFAATFLSSALVDRAGRRPLLLGSNAGIAACHAALGGYFYAQAAGLDVAAAWWLPVCATSLFLVLNAVGVGALLMVVVNEFFSPEAMPIAMSISIGVQTVTAAAVIKMYVVLLGWLQMHGCYWFFAACCILSNVYIFFFLPESKNRPINDILAELRGESKKQKKFNTHYDPVDVTESQK